MSPNQISPHTLLKLKGTIGGKDVTVLLDDGSSHDFISTCFASTLNHPITTSQFKVKTAFNNQKYNCTQQMENVEIAMANFTQTRTFLVAPLHGVDAILGMPF